MGRVDVALEEFKALRAEIVARQQSQTTIVNVALTVTAAIASVAFAVGSTGASDRLDILLALPIVLCGLGLTYLTHSHASHLIGAYIREDLWPELRGAAPGEHVGSTPTDELPSWEESVAEWRRLDRASTRPGGYLSWLPGVFIFGVPSITALIINWSEAPKWVPWGAEGGQLRAAWLLGAIAVVGEIALMITVAVSASHSAEAKPASPPVTKR